MPAVGASNAKFGPREGLWLIGGCLLASFLGSFLVEIVWGIGIGFAAGAHGATPALPTPGITMLAFSVLVGTLLSAAWGITYPL